MANGQVNFFLDSTDDPLLPDQVPSFDGGQFSNLRANLLQPNQSTQLSNCDIDKLGKLRTRRGTVLICDPALAIPEPGGVAGKVIQGLTSYQTPDANYIVAANNGKLWKWTGTAWVQIALGGVHDNAEILIYREGLINQSTVSTSLPAGGYSAGSTILTVDGITGIVGNNEKLYFTNNIRNNYYEYTIASHAETAGNTTTITLEEPGLVFDVKDNWKFTVARPARINNGAGYAGGYNGAMTIDGYTGQANVGESFVIRSENKRHTISAASGAPTTSITDGTVPLQTDWAAFNVTDPIMFVQGNDMLFFCDGVGPIYGWKDTVDGGTLMNLSALNTVDYLTGSNLGRAATAPPTGCHVLLWFQNRLIASGIDADPDAIFFSDFFDPTSWDRNYQLVRIGGGESDPITGLLAWTDYNMLVFKKNSIYIINLDPSQNPNPDDPTLLVASFSVKQLHKLIGCPAPRTAVQVGGGSTTPGSDIFFMDGDKKVHSIRRVMAAETQQEVGTAISLPIQDILDATNIDNIDAACAMYHNEHYILGIPSTRGPDSGILHSNVVVAYNMLTQSWCGTWTWAPSCFARRTDLGSYSKLIFGDFQATVPGQIKYGRILQWMDDISLDEETDDSYRDFVKSDTTGGKDIQTQITTRAITFGDSYSYKTGLNVEFEFDESAAQHVMIKAILDKVVQPAMTEAPFTTLSQRPIVLRPGVGPVLPFTLPLSSILLRKAFDLQQYGQWRELQFQIHSSLEKLSIRSIRVTGFIDTLTLQTIP